MQRKIIDLIMQVEKRRQEYVRKATDEKCPRSSAESISRDKFYGELLDTTMMLVAFLEDNEDDLK